MINTATYISFPHPRTAFQVKFKPIGGGQWQVMSAKQSVQQDWAVKPRGSFGVFDSHSHGAVLWLLLSKKRTNRAKRTL